MTVEGSITDEELFSSFNHNIALMLTLKKHSPDITATEAQVKKKILKIFNSAEFTEILKYIVTTNDPVAHLRSLWNLADDGSYCNPLILDKMCEYFTLFQEHCSILIRKSKATA